MAYRQEVRRLLQTVGYAQGPLKAPFQRLLVFGPDDHLTAVALPRALGGDLCVLSQGHVDDTALIGRHGLQGDGPARGGDALRHVKRHVGQGLITPLLVPLDINKEVRPRLEPPADDDPDQKLETPERLATAPDEKSRVITLYLEYWPSKVGPLRLFEAHDDRHPELRHQAVKDLGRRLHQVGGLVQQGYPNPGGLATNAQDSRLADANDVYFDLAAFCVELF